MKTYTFAILYDDVTDRDLDICENYHNLNYEKTKGISDDEYYKIYSKVYGGPSIGVAESSIFMGLENENSLRGVMYDSFNLWDDDDMVATMLKLQRNIGSTFKYTKLTQDKIDVFKLKYAQLEKNPDWGDKPDSPKEEVFKFLEEHIGKRLFIFC